MGEIISKWINDMSKQGITITYVESMKDRILQSHKKYSLIYDRVDTDDASRKLRDVDVSKIGGINTGWHTANRSIYELFFSVTGELRIERESLHGGRIQENLNSLINNGIAYQHHFYIDSTKEPLLRDGLPKFDHFLEDDIYFSGATHRTVSAIMFNAPQMVGYVTTYRKNGIKSLNYDKYIQTKRRWRDFITSELNMLSIKNPENRLRNHIEFHVYLKEFPAVLLFIIRDPLIKATNENLIQTEEFKAEENLVDALIDRIKEIDDTLAKTRLKLLPFPLRIVRKSDFLYSCLAEIYVKPNMYIDIMEDSLIDIMKKIQVNARNQIISTHTPR
ncbi:hypothetical protein [Bacillus sp. 2205SS5-2]|uniref:hypothetical protein n=1 Tax=Bacillus sp. 2205SS5-2 TaxID=3109031 RepID=UPI0030075AEB